MRSAGLPRTKWKHHMLTQLTLAAKEPIVALLDDDLAGYEEVKEALLSRKITPIPQRLRLITPSTIENC